MLAVTLGFRPPGRGGVCLSLRQPWPVQLWHFVDRAKRAPSGFHDSVLARLEIPPGLFPKRGILDRLQRPSSSPISRQPYKLIRESVHHPAMLSQALTTLARALVGGTGKDDQAGSRLLCVDTPGLRLENTAVDGSERPRMSFDKHNVDTIAPMRKGWRIWRKMSLQFNRHCGAAGSHFASVTGVWNAD